MNGIPRVPLPDNEPVLSYAPGTPERAEIKTRLEEMANEVIDIPIIINGEEIRTGNTVQSVMPHDHGHVLAECHQASEEHVQQAIDAAEAARKDWASWPWHERAEVFLRAAELLAGPWRSTLNGATMLCQSKTVHQAEIDAACELVDFFRFNVYFAQEIYEDQPLSGPGAWNQLEYRPLDGFVYAITPFNFTSIAGNLPSAPAIMGNTAVWKPAGSTIYSGYYLMRLFEAAGMPPGVINFVPGSAVKVSEVVMNSPHLGGIHFTGSTGVFQSLWKTVGDNIADYGQYPRLVGETGGKDFVVAHPTADPDALVTALVRGAFEYQGQKCSAASRAYIPKSLWARIEDTLVQTTNGLAMGDPADFRNFVGAVIDRPAFDKISSYIEGARESDDADIIAGGETDDSRGFFIRPTIIQAYDPEYVSMCEEIFGPILTVHVYDDDAWEETLELVDRTSPYALTGAVFARDKKAVQQAHDALRFAAGNFYVNDKPTGAVVGQQPFGGSRASGTNDKAGSKLNLLRWVSARTIKVRLNPPTDHKYPFMAEE